MLVQDAFDGVSCPTLIALTAFGAVLYIVVIAVYRLYFHPLAKFPGPFWARLTVIPSWLHTRNQDRHIWLHGLQEKYGPEFRYRPDSVLINTPTAYKTIFGPKGNVRKSDYYVAWRPNVHSFNTWNSTDLHMHARKRRVLNQAFSDKAMRSAEVFIHRNTDRWLELLADRKGEDDWTETTDMADWINYLVFDILGDLCFGKSFDMKEPDSELRHIPEMLVGFLGFMNPIIWSPLGKLYLAMKPRGLDASMMYIAPPAVKVWRNFVDGLLEKRTKVEKELEENPKPDSEVRKDFFHWLFKAKDPETGELGYTLSELFAECELLTIAGSDTTAIVLSAILFYLARNTDVQHNLAQEILTTYSNRDEIKGDFTLHSCKYLTAVIQEAARMTPPVSAEPPRKVLPGGTHVDGHFIPEGQHVSIGMYCLSYNENAFPEPFNFRPERWIVSDKQGSTAEDVARAEDAFCAFSYGSRGCVGKNLAWLEMRIVIAKLVWMFEVKADPVDFLGAGGPGMREGRKNEGQYQTYEMHVSGRKGPMVMFKQRSH